MPQAPAKFSVNQEVILPTGIRGYVESVHEQKPHGWEYLVRYTNYGSTIELTATFKQREIRVSRSQHIEIKEAI